MTSINRTIAPPAHPVGSIQLIEPEQVLLNNNLPVFYISSPTQPVLKVEITFNAGSAHHNNPLIPSFTSSMLQEGTRHRSAKEIIDAVDYYGAFLEIDHDKDFASVTLYTLNRYLAQTLPVIAELITEPTFPAQEWSIMRSNKLDKFRMNLGKVSFIAGKAFQEAIFRGTAYGTPFGEKDYISVERQDLQAFWLSHYGFDKACVFVSGDVTAEVLDTLKRVLGQSGTGAYRFDQPLPAAETSLAGNSRELFIEKADAIQNAIRIGRRMFTKDHPDFFGMKVLTTILGGYFGSRLMSNIREDKGYTYGIGAGTASYKSDGYFFISTEVGSDVSNAALEEIYKEIAILQDNLVEESELSLVKNYLLGNLLKSFDGPFERMERFKSTYLYGIDHAFFNRYTDAIKNATAEQLRELARKWLQKKDLIQLVAGR